MGLLIRRWVLRRRRSSSKLSPGVEARVCVLFVAGMGTSVLEVICIKYACQWYWDGDGRMDGHR